MTELQAAMIAKIARSEYTPVNGAEPTSRQDTETYQEMIIESNIDKGVFTTLLTAGMVWSTGRGTDAICGLTDTGFAAYQTR
jgi:hypothetical protein